MELMDDKCDVDGILRMRRHFRHGMYCKHNTWNKTVVKLKIPCCMVAWQYCIFGVCNAFRKLAKVVSGGVVGPNHEIH